MHRHTHYGDEYAAMTARLSPRVVRLVREWASLHETELLPDWRLAQARAPTDTDRATVLKRPARIVKAETVGDYRLRLTFDDGVEGEIDIASFVEFRGVFEPLQDPAKFAEVRLDAEAGTIVWPTGADLCPDVLYSKVTGKPIPWATEEAGSPSVNQIEQDEVVP